MSSLCLGVEFWSVTIRRREEEWRGTLFKDDGDGTEEKICVLVQSA